MIKLPVYSDYNEIPSYGDKRLHFDGYIEFTCSKCGEVNKREGNDLIYAPSSFTFVPFQCMECYLESEAFQLKDIHNHCAHLEKVSDSFKFRFFQRTYVEINSETGPGFTY